MGGRGGGSCGLPVVGGAAGDPARVIVRTFSYFPA